MSETNNPTIDYNSDDELLKQAITAYQKNDIDNSSDPTSINNSIGNENSNLKQPTLSIQSSGEMCDIYNIKLTKTQDGMTHLTLFDKGQEICDKKNKIDIDNRTGKILNADQVIYEANKEQGNMKLLSYMSDSYIPNLISYYYFGFNTFGDKKDDSKNELMFLNPNYKITKVGGQDKTLDEIITIIDSMKEENENINQFIQLLTSASEMNKSMYDEFLKLKNAYNQSKGDISSEEIYNNINDNFIKAYDNFITTFSKELTTLSTEARKLLETDIGYIAQDNTTGLKTPNSKIEILKNKFETHMFNSYHEYAENAKTLISQGRRFLRRGSRGSITSNTSPSTGVSENNNTVVANNRSITSGLSNAWNTIATGATNATRNIINYAKTPRKQSNVIESNTPVGSDAGDNVPNSIESNVNRIEGGKKSRRRRGGMKKVKQNKTKRIHAIITRRRKQMKKAGTKRR